VVAGSGVTAFELDRDAACGMVDVELSAGCCGAVARAVNEASACTAMLSGTTRYRECVGRGRSASAGGVGGATAIGVGTTSGVGAGGGGGRAANGSGMSLTGAGTAGGLTSLDGVTAGVAAVSSGTATGWEAGCATGATGSVAGSVVETVAWSCTTASAAGATPFFAVFGLSGGVVTSGVVGLGVAVLGMGTLGVAVLSVVAAVLSVGACSMLTVVVAGSSGCAPLETDCETDCETDWGIDACAGAAGCAATGAAGDQRSPSAVGTTGVPDWV
jgi:hypothetical protein